MRAFLTILITATAASAGEPPVCVRQKPGAAVQAAASRARAPARRVAASAPRPSKAAPPVQACFEKGYPGDACLAHGPLCDQDLAVGRIAWKYFENNFQPATGLVNAADKYPSTTSWDIASALAGTVSAHELGIIGDKDFDDRVTPLLGQLNTQQLFQGAVPNKAYNTSSGAMADYTNKATPDGIGFSALDLARLASWLEILSCFSPQYAEAVDHVLLRWSYCGVVDDGQMFGAMVNPATKKVSKVQEGRLGYEQYGGKLFAALGFDQTRAAPYANENRQTVQIYGVPIAYDQRDPRKLGAFNFVVTESYALDALEFGRDRENGALLNNIYEVQKRRWERTGIVTAVSEDNVDRPPWFVYNTIYADGSPWNAITDTGLDQSPLRTVSTKAAFALAALFPADPYSRVLMSKVQSAYDPARGWYSGIYESGIGFNKAVTANTNGIILQTLLYKVMGPLHAACSRCGRGLHMPQAAPALATSGCLPSARTCGACTAAR